MIISNHYFMMHDDNCEGQRGRRNYSISIMNMIKLHHPIMNNRSPETNWKLHVL